jgi:hypothetical protein
VRVQPLRARDVPALEKPRAATRAAPKERAMATIVMRSGTGVEMIGDGEGSQWMGVVREGESSRI